MNIKNSKHIKTTIRKISAVAMVAILALPMLGYVRKAKTPPKNPISKIIYYIF